MSFKGGTLHSRETSISDPVDFHRYKLIQNDVDVITEISSIEDFINHKFTNLLYVIDMQNDFILPAPEGQFPVVGGKAMAEELNEFINANHQKFDKIIFSRDYHEENHCGFQKGGSHPPHCVQCSKGAEFYPHY